MRTGCRSSSSRTTRTDICPRPSGKSSRFVVTITPYGSMGCNLREKTEPSVITVIHYLQIQSKTDEKWSQGQGLLALLGVKLAVGEVVGVLADCELLPDLVVKLLILLPNQPVYLVHPHVVLLHPYIVGVLDTQHPFGLLVLAGVDAGVSWTELVVIDGGLRLVLGFNWQLATGSPHAGGEGRALVANAFLQDLPAALLIEKILTCLVAEGDESVDALHFCILTVLGLELTEERLLEFGVVVVVGVVEAVHAVRGAVRVVPDELLRLVELLALDELLRLRVGRVRKDRLQVVVLNRRLGRVLHAQQNYPPEGQNYTQTAAEEGEGDKGTSQGK